MKIDYAKYTFVTSPPKKKNRWPSILFFIIILMALVFAGIFWVANHAGLRKTEMKTKPGQQAEETQEVHFNFYSELPTMRMEAATPVQAAPASVKSPAPVVTAPSKKYILQLGLFKDLNSAGQQRLSLLLAGCESEVVHSIANNEKIFRVQQGPFSTINEAKAAQKTLQRKGIEAKLILF